MEFLLVIAFIAILVMLFVIRAGQKTAQQRNEQVFKSIKKDLLDLKEQLAQPRPADIKKETSLSPTDEKVVQWRPEPKPIIVPKPKEREDTPVVKQPEPVRVMPAAATRPVEPPLPTESWWTKWVRNNPDVEKFIGENLANKIGIAILVLGIGFFVKYAIDQDWIKEAGRVAIGIGCGILMIGIAHYLRNTYRSFSSVMAGGGIAVFYFTIAFAFHEYNMFPQTTAFVMMVVITAFAVTISLLYDKIELAVIAVVGGFLVPFLVSNGSGNYIVLFSYLLILNVGILFISYFKRWPLLHILAFFFTLVIYMGWLLQQTFLGNTVLPHRNALLFASAFYSLFMVIVLLYNIRKQRPFKALDFTLMMLITFSYYAEGMLILGEWNNGAYQGLFTIIMSVINLCLAWYLYATHKGDKNLLYLLIGLTLTFLSLAAPVQLHGHSITMFWAAEAVLVYWLHQKSRISIFKYSSAVLLVMMLISLLMDWSLANSASASYLVVIFTSWPGVVTNAIAIVSLGILTYLLYKQKEGVYVLDISNSAAAGITAVLALVILYCTCIFGVNWHFAVVSSHCIPNVYHQLITYVFIAGMLLAAKKYNPFRVPALEMILVLAGFGVFVFSTALGNSLVNGVAGGLYASKHLYMHWVADAMFLLVFYVLVMIVRKRNITSAGIIWLINILLLVFFSIECRHLYVSLLGDAKLLLIYHAQYIKAGLTIVWGIFSFVIMWLGMKHKNKTLRIISLSLFTLALLKLFLFDIRNISAGGKIAAFIMLGVLLLVISFMYQRLKKIIIDNEEKTV